MPLLSGKHGIVFGVANKRSIAWAIAQAWHREGAKLAFTYQGERLKENVEDLAGTFGPDTLILPCDVTKDEDIENVFKTVGERFGKLHLLLHSVAYAPKEALEGDFVSTSREAFRVAHDVSAYSLVALARAAAPLMPEGGVCAAKRTPERSRDERHGRIALSFEDGPAVVLEPAAAVRSAVRDPPHHGEKEMAIGRSAGEIDETGDAAHRPRF